MSIEILCAAFTWALLLNIALLLLIWLLFRLRRDWIFNLHSRWFKLSPASFEISYHTVLCALAGFILAFFLAPWLALCIIY